jgi:hypothetical protein
MVVANHTGLYCPRTAPSMTCMTLLTYILLVQFVAIFGFIVSPNSMMQVEMKFGGCVSTESSVNN